MLKFDKSDKVVCPLYIYIYRHTHIYVCIFKEIYDKGNAVHYISDILEGVIMGFDK
jgi:hypothetical protein